MRNMMAREPPVVPGNALAGFEINAMIYDTMVGCYSGGFLSLAAAVDWTIGERANLT